MSGAVVLDQLAVYEEVLGRAVIERAIARLEPARRQEMEELLPIGWVRCTTWIATIEDIAGQVGREPTELSAELSERGLTRTFGGVWRVLLRLTTDAALLRRAATIWSKTFDKGTLSMEMRGQDRAALTLRGFPEVHEIDLNGSAIAMACILRLGAREDVEVTYRRTPDGAVFDARWKS